MRATWMALALLVGCGGETGDDGDTDDTDGAGTGVGDDDDDDDDGGGGGSPEEEFGLAFVDRYCDEWDACVTSGEPCLFEGTTTGGGTTTTTTDPCEFDAVAAQACLDGEWTCNTEYAGFEFVMTPDACGDVCG